MSTDQLVKINLSKCWVNVSNLMGDDYLNVAKLIVTNRVESIYLQSFYPGIFWDGYFAHSFSVGQNEVRAFFFSPHLD